MNIHQMQRWCSEGILGSHHMRPVPNTDVDFRELHLFALALAELKLKSHPSLLRLEDLVK